ncbi:SEC-C metal-binding domain-containing protein [Streptomyces sp. NBC_00873]|uniref:SEC-C metal-binding domain-containing protein n=1 Tax=Streptomyces sp. NBC_00873 TaxID=2975852 RepID=UPI0038676BD1
MTPSTAGTGRRTTGSSCAGPARTSQRYGNAGPNRPCTTATSTLPTPHGSSARPAATTSPALPTCTWSPPPWPTSRHTPSAQAKTRQHYGEWHHTIHPDQTLTWPPARNGPCWCESGRKYKKCCGTPAKN